jgi:hypothetical protein
VVLYDYQLKGTPTSRISHIGTFDVSTQGTKLMLATNLTTGEINLLLLLIAAGISGGHRTRNHLFKT